ncbi:hypothetical protein OPKNFCMD_3264 [Methylobacterium crusticola]|uniref:Uncharacterized protein n=1 Tax=Methylobacterium crusticola TaxID=1697972 RepID=A0ABQ4QYS6_9HYPH|nr:hypothetical protein [Methylobacterium crusticola]GJD50521.1 hypothetical protein OPKNFCMD_3264 [Methylobacterium crusticola]
MKLRPQKQPERDSEWATFNVEHEFSGRGPFPPDRSEMKRRIAENPISVLGECKYKLHALQSGYRRELYEVLADGYGVALHFKDNLTAYKEFLGLQFFKGGKYTLKPRKQQLHALRHVLNYVFDAKSKHMRNRTGKYAAGLENYMKIGVPANRIAKMIEDDGGIEALYQKSLDAKAALPKRRSAQQLAEENETLFGTAPVSVRDSSAESKDLPLDDLEDGPDEENDNTAMSDAEGDNDNDGSKRKPLSGHGRDNREQSTVEFEVTEGRLNRFLALDKGRRATVEVESLGRDAKGWLRLGVKKVVWRRNERG